MRTPCQEDPEVWVSDSPALRREAIKACLTCPALDWCMAEARKVEPAHGVWGGVDYTRSTERRGGTPSPKWCELCGQRFTKKPNTSRNDWERARFCGRTCANRNAAAKSREAAAA